VSERRRTRLTPAEREHLRRAIDARRREQLASRDDVVSDRDRALFREFQAEDSRLPLHWTRRSV
jgi:hypothetical protein